MLSEPAELANRLHCGSQHEALMNMIAICDEANWTCGKSFEHFNLLYKISCCFIHEKFAYFVIADLK